MIQSDDLQIKNRIFQNLNKLYGEKEGKLIYSSLLEILNSFKGIHKFGKERYLPTEKDIILITYGDQILEQDRAPLMILHQFLNKYLRKTINTIHLLPFFPYSSDDGFSVIDYINVNPDLGTWDDIDKMKLDYNLMFDFVINHVSQKSDWFQEFLKNNPKYLNYFITLDKDTNVSSVVRPRALPLLTKFETKSGSQYVWTTFSEDQIDFNFKNKEVLLEIINILLLYIEKGAKYIRLDAIGFVWKELGTSCIHLEQTHLLVKLIRDILDFIAPEVNLITETNVPHKENISYFGNGFDEAQLVYQFPLPPLILYSFLTGNTRYLTEWASGLGAISKKTTFLNFTASHDGIGLRPIENILNNKEIEFLLEQIRKRGGYISYKNNLDGSKSPYELNITYFDAIIDPSKIGTDADLEIKKFIASQAIALSLAGLPGIYIHNLFGTKNFYEGVKDSGIYRRINREKFKLEELEKELMDKTSITHKTFNSFLKLIKIRIIQKAFNPYSYQKILDINDSLFCLIRMSIDTEQIIFVIINVSSKFLSFQFKIKDLGLKDERFKNLTNLVDKEKITIVNDEAKINIKPYDILWLSNI